MTAHLGIAIPTGIATIKVWKCIQVMSCTQVLPPLRYGSALKYCHHRDIAKSQGMATPSGSAILTGIVTIEVWLRIQLLPHI